MSRIIAILLLAVAAFTLSPHVELSAKSKSRTKSVISINGLKYYLHSVEKGDTLYSLSKLYDVSEESILSINNDLSGGLKLNTRIKIPHNSSVVASDIIAEIEEEAKQNQAKYMALDSLMRDSMVLDSVAMDSLLMESMLLDSLTKLMPAEWHRVSRDGVAPAGLKYYDIAEGDDMVSVAAAHEMSVEQLRRVNSLRGDNIEFDSVRFCERPKILVRDGESSRSTAAYTSDRAETIERRVSDVEFNMLSQGDTLHVALMLPLSANGRTMKPFVEFYQGVLLGVEELQKAGRSVVLNLYNTERNVEVVRDIISQPSFMACELIIGPVYENLLNIVLNDAELRSVPVVSPLAAVAKSDSPVLFQMAADSKHRYDKMDDLLGEGRRVTLIEGETNDDKFREEVMRILASRDVEYLVHEYEYEHPSLIEEREREAEKLIKAAKELAEELGGELEQSVIDSLSVQISKSDLTPLLLGESVQADRLLRDGVMGSEEAVAVADSVAVTEEKIEAEILPVNVDEEAEVVEASPEEIRAKEIERRVAERLAAELERRRNEPLRHTLFIMSNNEIEVDRILSALSSAYAAQIAKSRGSGRNIRKHIQYDVVANPEWRRYKNIDRAIYFRNHVSVFSSYLAGRDGESIRTFDSRYGGEFGEFPSLYSYRGYDVMMIFGEGIFSGDILSKMRGRTYQPLQSKYRFEQDEERTTIVNTNWMRENYNSNFTKDID